ncbi:IS3 family transposase [Paenibacillus glycanilyticus]|uniref:IS3 family transposase n=1 Tax=Paenibacillus glycanilyticus TaxID=126569 RepID=UPI0019105C3E|nr:IS3 family transposase [Paenibacillus glycanilyticus]
MSKRLFTPMQIRVLESNPNVAQVSEKAITYKPEFKVQAVESYKDGHTPMQIFLEAGFDIAIIGAETPKKGLKRWRRTYDLYGEEGLRMERRGKASTGRPSSKELSIEEKLKRAEAKIKLLEAENGILKKARGSREAGEAQTLTPSETFELIESTIRKHQLEGLNAYLCAAAGVSRSGYYAWLKAEPIRQKRENADEADYQLIQTHFSALKGKAGALTIKMHLERKDTVIMNHKKIRRLMRKYNLVAKVRQANPYRKMAKATHEHRTCPNLLERQFKQDEPGKVLLTDITYIKYGNGQRAYLSCVKDGSTNQIPAHVLSTSLELQIVEKTLEELLSNMDYTIHPEAILHSDQGMHYTHPVFQNKVKKAGFKQSMSRKGNCWDNAPMESFFGHMKDELEYEDCQTIQELRQRVNEYILEYNTERYQWGLKKMTPDEYRSHLLTA